MAHTAWHTRAGLPPGIASMVRGRLNAVARGVADMIIRSATPLKRGAMNFEIVPAVGERDQLKRFYILLD